MFEPAGPFFLAALQTEAAVVRDDVAGRLAEHNSGGMRAAHYTRGRRPVVLVYIEEARSRSAAARREYAIKQLTRQAKDDLVRKSRRSIQRSIQSVAVRT